MEDCSALVNVQSIDLSGNPLVSKESISLLFTAPSLTSLDLRNCPVAGSVENFRRWVIASAPQLKVLDGKDVSPLEVRYGFQLFPELKAKNAARLAGATSTVAATLVLPSLGQSLKDDDDDLFGSGALPVASKPSPPKVDFFSVDATSPSNGDGGKSFFKVTPGPSPKEAPVAVAVPVDAPVEMFGNRVGAGLFENDILNKHASDVVTDDMFTTPTARPITPNRAIQSPKKKDIVATAESASVSVSVTAPEEKETPSQSEPVKASSPIVAASLPPPPAPKEGEDKVLDNDVLSGKSFLDQKTFGDDIFSAFSPSNASSASSKKVEASIDVAEMFFENSTPAPVHAKKKASADDEMNIFSSNRAVPPAAVPAKPSSDVEFGGPKMVRHVPEKATTPEKKSSTVETFLEEEEAGEVVSYGVEQICGYIMRAFRPKENVESMSGLFEFTVGEAGSADTFYVRVSSLSGVSVCAGHVPLPEKRLIDCKISISEEVLYDMLNGRTEPSKALLSGKMNVQGELQKLFLFRDVFRFALSRFNLYQEQWNECVREEEREMAELARGNVLEEDFSRALEFLLSVWKGYVPDSWGPTVELGLVVISQLPDNIYYKGYRVQQKYFPPKVILKMHKNWVEMVQYSEEELAKGKLICEISGKKSIIRSMLTGAISLRHVQNMLVTESESQYRYTTTPYVFDPANPDDCESPPFLSVFNTSPAAEATNDFDQVMRCFDINMLSYDRFLAEKKLAVIKKAAAEESKAQRIMRDNNGVASPTKALSPTSASSPNEWVGKLREAKDGLMQRINNAAPASGKRFDMDDIFGDSSVKKSDSSDTVVHEKELVFIRASSSNAEAEKGFTPSAGFSDYEI